MFCFDVCTDPLPRWFSICLFTINSVFNLCQLWSGNIIFFLEFTERVFLYRFDNLFFQEKMNFLVVLHMCTTSTIFLDRRLSRPCFSLDTPVFSVRWLVSLIQRNFLLPRMNFAPVTEWFIKYHLSHKRLHSIDSVVHRSRKSPIAVTKTKRDKILISTMYRHTTLFYFNVFLYIRTRADGRLFFSYAQFPRPSLEKNLTEIPLTRKIAYCMMT